MHKAKLVEINQKLPTLAKCKQVAELHSELKFSDATSSMSQEWKDNVAQINPLGRNGQPEDVAGAILMLASESAKFITGTYLIVSGGAQIL